MRRRCRGHPVVRPSAIFLLPFHVRDFVEGCDLRFRCSLDGCFHPFQSRHTGGVCCRSKEHAGPSTIWNEYDALVRRLSRYGTSEDHFSEFRLDANIVTIQCAKFRHVIGIEFANCDRSRILLRKLAKLTAPGLRKASPRDYGHFDSGHRSTICGMITQSSLYYIRSTFIIQYVQTAELRS